MNSPRRIILGAIRKRNKNIQIYLLFRDEGFEYIVNPNTLELHHVGGIEEFSGSHNLAIANLEEFIGIKNMGAIPIHACPDGTEIPIYDVDTLELIEEYRLNKCKICYPE